MGVGSWSTKVQEDGNHPDTTLRIYDAIGRYHLYVERWWSTSFKEYRVSVVLKVPGSPAEIALSLDETASLRTVLDKAIEEAKALTALGPTSLPEQENE